MIDTTATINAYEKDGTELSVDGDITKIICSSHHNSDTLVIIKCGDGSTYTVLARDLISAIRRCS